MNHQPTILESIVDEFDIEGDFQNVFPITNGHINTTFRVDMQTTSGTRSYLLQKINVEVFQAPSALMDNIFYVTQFLDSELESSGMSPQERERRVLHVVKTRGGDLWHPSDKYGHWRMYPFISNAHTVDANPSLDEIYQAASGFGEFIRQLLAFPSNQLAETIPDFHHGPSRFANFKKSVANDVVSRASSVRPEIEFIRAHEWLLAQPNQMIESGRLPIRVTHNDTKSNNVLLDNHTNQAVCVIDLDTVMPGIVMFDFGDLVRTTCTMVAEDEQDTSTIIVDSARLASATRGFLAGTGGLLTDAEIESLRIGPAYMALIMATRFLTDYLNGDIYYQIQHDDHNLQRGRAQLRLAELLLESTGELEYLLNRRNGT